METKRRLFGLIAIVAIIVLLATACDSGLDLPDVPEIPGNPVSGPSETYTGEKNGTTFIFTVSAPPTRAVHAVGDDYALTVKSGSAEKTSSGNVTGVTGTTISVQPAYKDAQVITVTISDSSITGIFGTITFDDGSAEQGPGSFMPDDGGESESGDGDEDGNGSEGGGTSDNGGGSSGGGSSDGSSGGGSGTSDNGGGSGSGGGTSSGENTPPSSVPVIGVSLNKSSSNLLVDGTEALTATITPSNASNQNLTWSSSNLAIAAVSASGMVTAVAPGNTTITVTTVDGGKKAVCTVTVNPVPVTGISVNKPSTSLLVGGTEVLYANITPSNATNQNVNWESSNKSVVTVTENGLITAVTTGTATITAKTVDGDKTASCAVTVSTVNIAAISVSLNKLNTSLDVGGTETLIAAITPDNATNQKVTWSSDKPAITMVSQGGIVTAVNVGTASITVTTDDGGKKATCIITVNPIPVTDVSLNKSDTNFDVGSTENLYAIIRPSNATNQKIVWSSNNETVATVSKDGVVTAVAQGSATITVTTDNSGKKASCIVTVSSPIPVTPTSVTASAASSGLIMVRWSSVTGATGYKVYRSSSSSGTYSSVGDVTTTSFTNSGVFANTTYYYKVSAYNSAGESLQSSSVSVTTPLSIPTTPSNVTASVASSGIITVSWLSVTEATGYKVYRSSSSSGTYSNVGDVTTTSYTDTGLSTNTTYYYKVSAYNSAGESVQSPSIMAAIPFVRVTNITGVPTSGTVGVPLNFKATVEVEPANATNKTITMWMLKDAGTTGAFLLAEDLINTGAPGTITLEATIANGLEYWNYKQEFKINIASEETGTQIFTSGKDLSTWLSSQKPNTPTTAYTVKVNVNDFQDSIREALINNPGKYVYLDLSGSAIKEMPLYAFSKEDPSFTGCATLTGVIFPNNLTNTGYFAFYNCSNLSSVTIPDSVTVIEQGTFNGCTSLTSISIPNSVKRIGAYAFNGCTGLKNITIPNSVTEIWSGAFRGCTGLTSVSIPASVTEILTPPIFNDCTSLSSINVDAGNNVYASDNGVLYNKSKTALLEYPMGKIINAFTIPKGVTSIGKSTFYGRTDLFSVTIPDSVTNIGDYAFKDCTGLTSVIFETTSKVSSIGDSVFSGCTSLSNITIPDSVTNIGRYAFWCNYSLTNITIPNNASIEEYAFCYSGLTSVTIGKGVNSIRECAFLFCSGLTMVKFEGTIPSTGFYGKSDSSVTVFDGDLRTKFYATDTDNGTPGTYTTTAPTNLLSKWTKQ